MQLNSMQLEVGIEKEVTIVVSVNDTAAVHGSGLLDVYATPAMVAFMENTAHTSIADFIPENTTTVGIEINVQHLKATPIGGSLTCKSKLINIEGKRLIFEIQVRDKNDLVGEALHIRYIVDTKRFMEKVSQF